MNTFDVALQELHENEKVLEALRQEEVVSAQNHERYVLQLREKLQIAYKNGERESRSQTMSVVGHTGQGSAMIPTSNNALAEGRSSSASNKRKHLMSPLHTSAIDKLANDLSTSTWSSSSDDDETSLSGAGDDYEKRNTNKGMASSKHNKRKGHEKSRTNEAAVSSSQPKRERDSHRHHKRNNRETSPAPFINSDQEMKPLSINNSYLSQTNASNSTTANNNQHQQPLQAFPPNFDPVAAFEAVFREKGKLPPSSLKERNSAADGPEEIVEIEYIPEISSLSNSGDKKKNNNHLSSSNPSLALFNAQQQEHNDRLSIELEEINDSSYLHFALLCEHIVYECLEHEFLSFYKEVSITYSAMMAAFNESLMVLVGHYRDPKPAAYVRDKVPAVNRLV